MKKHNFVELAEVQREQRTLYCAGLDPHSFGSYENNKAVYQLSSNSDLIDYYRGLCDVASVQPSEKSRFALVLASVEGYLRNVIRILVEECNIRVFKPQAGFYEQFGPVGIFMLQRIRNYIRDLEIKHGIRLICILDCKRGDIATTQAAYFLGLMGNLEADWGVNYAPFDFDIINVTPWMGEDVMVMGNEENPGLGLKLMREGKGIIGVNKTSNPSGPQYQDLNNCERRNTVQMQHVADLNSLTYKYGLLHEELSSIGIVVGSTRQCDGRIRGFFPSTTLLVPGFGAQGGKFSLIMPELIRVEKWNGQGAVFSSSRGTLYPYFAKYGGSGERKNLKQDLVVAIQRFREAERAAYETDEVKGLGIAYPFSAQQ